MANILIFGAGASGRGHMGQLAFESGHAISFVDRDRALVERLRAAGAYTVRLVGPRPRDVAVDRFAAFHLDDRDAVEGAFREADVVFTVVCPNNLGDVAEYLRPMVVRWLEAGGPGAKDLLACENMDRGSTTFRRLLLDGFPAGAGLRALLDDRMGFVDTMIARVVAKPKDPLFVLGEEYSEWTADRHGVRGRGLLAPGALLPPEAGPSSIRTLELVDRQDRFLQRKLYIHNTGHAVFGYLGFLRGYTWVHEAARDPAIRAAAAAAIEESGWAIQREHGFAEDVIRAYRQALLDKCPSDALPDEILRVVREPLRKLGPTERFFGPVSLLLAHGRQPDRLLVGPCAAMLSRIDGDAESSRLARRMEAGGPRAVLAAQGVEVPEAVLARIEALLPEVRREFGRRP